MVCFVAFDACEPGSNRILRGFFLPNDILWYLLIFNQLQVLKLFYFVFFLAYEYGNVLPYKMLNSVLVGMGATLGNIARGYHSPHKITFGLKT